MIDHETELRTKLANERENNDIVRRYGTSVEVAAEKWGAGGHQGSLWDAVIEQLILDRVVRI